MAEEFNPNAVVNPSSGLLARNPTHIREAEHADNQDDIVRSIQDTGVKRMKVTYNYTDIDKEDPPPLAGILSIRSMSVGSAVRFCKNMMRSRPNIFKIHILLGDYPSTKQLVNVKTRLLGSDKQRFHTEIGEKMGDVLSDKTMHVTSLKYTVHNTEPGMFRATAEVMGTTEEEYNNDKYFAPIIDLEFIKTT